MRRKTSIALAALIMACSVTGCQGAVSTITRNVIENNQADSAAAVPETPESTETETETETQIERREALVEFLLHLGDERVYFI